METLGLIVSVVSKLFGLIAFIGKRWAYATFIVLGLLYFPVSVGFVFNSRPCEWTFGLDLAVYSLTNFAHIVLFAVFFVMTIAQFRYELTWRTFGWSMLAVVVMGLLVELAEGLTGEHNCRMRDLIPDAAGGLLGAGLVYAGKMLWYKFRERRPVESRE